MRTVDRARRPPHQEGPVGVDGEVAVHPGDRLVRHGLGEVVVLVVLDVRRGNRVVVLPQGGFPLGALAGDEAVEVVEAAACGRSIVGAVGELVDRRVVVLAEGGRGITVVAKHLGDGGRGFGNDAGVAVPVVGQLGDLTESDSVVVTARHQGGPGRRAHRGGVEGVVGDALVGQARHRRCLRSRRRRRWAARTPHRRA